ncbi:MAG TPA: S8 family serine peptidase [Thermoanaerobaculia bacterium]|nr:S8 family serine peptidase [Thermoanaerobaculia bacterium]
MSSLAASRQPAGPGPSPSLARPARLASVVGDATGRGVRVAVLDSGVDPGWQHPRFGDGVGLLARRPARDEIDPASEFRLERTADVADQDGHGTACVDILLGIAPGVTIHPVRVFHRRRRTSLSVLVAALRWAVEQRMDVVHLSLGTAERRSMHPLYRACAALREAGTVVVAAARPGSGVSFPAIFDNTLGVTAGEFANVHDFAWCPQEAVECVAQGRRRARLVGGGRREVFSNSYAAPHVSALAALCIERRRRDGEARPGIEGIRRLLARCALPATHEPPEERR